MRLTPWLLAVLTFLMVVLVAGVLIYRNVFAQEEPVPQIRSQTLPMAMTDLEPGTMVTAAHLGRGPWTETDLETDVVRSVDGLIGRVVKNPIKAARPLRSTDFYKPGELPPLQVAPGMQAVSLRLGDSTAVVDGLIKPGEHVDIHMTVNDAPGVSNSQSLNGGMTLTLFRGVKVLAMNRSYTQNSPSVASGNVTTLEMTPEQARVMLLAQRRGDISLTFNPDGPGGGGIALDSDADRITLDQILGLAPEEEPEKPFRTEIYRRFGRSTLHFDEDGNRVSGYGGYGNGYGDDYYNGGAWDVPPYNTAPGGFRADNTSPGGAGGAGNGGGVEQQNAGRARIEASRQPAVENRSRN